MYSVQFLHVRLTLCDPMDRNTPGLPVHHQLQEPAQTHLHRVRDAMGFYILGLPKYRLFEKIKGDSHKRK